MFRSLDLGGSTSRIGTKNTIKEIDSELMEIDIKSKNKDYIEDKCSDFIIVSSTRKSLENRRFARNEAMGFFEGKTMVCDNQSTKSEQDITYINALYIIATNLLQEKKVNSQLDIGVCIPTSEFYSDDKDYPSVIKSNLAGDHSVCFPLLDNKIVRFTVPERGVKVFPEGVVAAYRFKNDKYMLSGNTIIVDIGYRSTDITILTKFRVVGRAAVSRPKGGINIEAVLRNELEKNNIFTSKSWIRNGLSNDYLKIENELYDITSIIDEAKIKDSITYLPDVIKKVKEQYGLDVTEDQVLDAVSHNYIMTNTEVTDITAHVISAKQNFAASIKQDIIDVLAVKMLSLSTINNILFIGRPFRGDITESYCLANMLMTELNAPLRCYTVPNLGTANVTEITEAMSKFEELANKATK